MIHHGDPRVYDYYKLFTEDFNLEVMNPVPKAQFKKSNVVQKYLENVLVGFFFNYPYAKYFFYILTSVR